FVNHSADGGNTGLSWANAYVALQSALDAAANNSAIDEIWVAKGTYYPTALIDPNEPRSAAFSLMSGVGIYGGFRGPDDSDPNNPYPGESSRSERNPDQNETILSGNIGDPNDPTDNCWHVIFAEDVDSTAVLNGFTVRGWLCRCRVICLGRWPVVL